MGLIWQVITAIVALTWIWCIWDIITAPTYPDDWEK
jgi:hypothetical protein